jgi:hypothetical protein
MPPTFTGTGPGHARGLVFLATRAGRDRAHVG